MESKYKDFKAELTTIDWVENFKLKPVTVKSDNETAHITKSGTKFEFIYNGILPYTESGLLTIQIDAVDYILKSYDFKEASDVRLADISYEHRCDIDGFQKGDICEGAFFRMCFFDDSKRDNIFYTKLEKAQHDGIIPWASKCVRLSVNEKRYDIIQLKNKEKSYLVIENLDEVSYCDFEKDSYAIQKGIGFLIGYMPGGENYIFSGDNFTYRRLSRKALKSIFHPVTSDPYTFVALHKHRDLAEFYKSKLKVIPTGVISNFVSQIRDNENLSVAIIFLMEVASLKSVVSMPGVFSVILESLGNIIIDERLIRKKLITDKDLADEIIKKLHSVIDECLDEKHTDAIQKIKRRLTDINQPINIKRIPNAVKLREPFDQLDITLSKSDEEAIEYRNDLLHGNILMNGEEKRTDKEIDNHMLYISAKLYTLISKLILKNSGYNGYIINHAKFYENHPELTDEAFFEQI